jgi:DNA invertase Pin-like site-specific DNA recombinase
MAQTDLKTRRCAIYTRKSSEEGLEQSFNSLDAQREACEAFVKSQAHEGWMALPEHYDDGGFTGGNMERPALAQLLGEIEQGHVDVVVVYKVDRLSRCLADFVRLIDLFDKTNISFVSVTQQFNTSTSMGRLTLNVLLSFAQFEREVTSERIRDKIAASKKRGMWMGGLVPLGYDRVEKQLVVNETEADVVRHIHSRYLALKCVRSLKAELDQMGYLSKERPDHHKSTGSKPFSRGALYTILKNPVYIGKVHHKGELHDGKHAAIVDNNTWEAVHDTLARNRKDKQAKASVKYPSLLAGLVYDDKGNRMSPTYTRRKNRHYAYYISQATLQYREDEAGSVVRIPGKTLDDAIGQLLLDLLSNPPRLLDILAPRQLPGVVLDSAMETASQLAANWVELPIKAQIPLINALVARIVVAKTEITLTLHRDNLISYLTGKTNGTPINDGRLASAPLVITAHVNLRRSGIETKLVYPSGPAPKVHQRSVKALQQALLKSLKWNDDLLCGAVKSIEALNERDSLDPRQTYRLRRLAFLAPEIIERVVSGDVPDTLTLEKLKQEFPLDWHAQRQHFGLTRPAH